MTSIKPVSDPLKESNEPPISGIIMEPDIPKELAPNHPGNNAIPPRTNLNGDPTAPPIGMSTPLWIQFKEWLEINSTSLVVMGIFGFILMSVR
jgi:hypothetical protein